MEIDSADGSRRISLHIKTNLSIPTRILAHLVEVLLRFPESALSGWRAVPPGQPCLQASWGQESPGGWVGRAADTGRAQLPFGA